MPPAPDWEERCDWNRFIAAHWPGLVAIDCATWEVPDPIGRKTERHHALYAMRIATREVRLLHASHVIPISGRSYRLRDLENRLGGASAA